jgi:hypothetical protein
MGGTMKTLAAALCLLPAVAWAQAGAVYNGMEITPLDLGLDGPDRHDGKRGVRARAADRPEQRDMHHDR